MWVGQGTVTERLFEIIQINFSTTTWFLMKKSKNSEYADM